MVAREPRRRSAPHTVIDAAVVVADDGSGIPTVQVFIVSERTDDAMERELLRLCKGRLSTYKVPRSFEIVGELPRTVTGKIQRFALRSGASAER